MRSAALVRSFLEYRFLRVYIVPGAVFQSVMVGGGYGTMAWGFLLIYGVPLLTVGVYRRRRNF